MRRVIKITFHHIYIDLGNKNFSDNAKKHLEEYVSTLQFIIDYHSMFLGVISFLA